MSSMRRFPTTHAILQAALVASALWLTGMSDASAQGTPAPQAKPSSGATADYGALFEEARKLLAAGQPKQALAVSERAIRSDGERYEAHLPAAAVLRDQKQFDKAAAHLATALTLAPDATKPAISRALTEVRVAALPPDAQRRLDAIMLVVDDAAKANASARPGLLREFMTRSTAFLEEYPSCVWLWQLRAAAALELDYAEMGAISVFQLDRLDASNSDPAVRRITAQMERKGWLNRTSPNFVMPDAETVRRWRAEAERGNAVLQLALGDFLQTYGSGDQKKQGVAWLAKAAEQGSAMAYWKLHWVYLADSSNEAEAARWALKAANLGLAWAQDEIADNYRQGIRGFPLAPVEAARWFRRAAMQESTESQIFLADMYRKGEGVKRSDDEALRWYRMAARSGLKESLATRNPLYTLALVFAADPDPRFRDGAHAVRLATVAVEKSEYKEMSLRALAAAYAETGDWANAVATQQKVLDLLNGLPDGEKEAMAALIADLAAQLEQYRNRRPLRGTIDPNSYEFSGTK